LISDVALSFSGNQLPVSFVRNESGSNVHFILHPCHLDVDGTLLQLDPTTVLQDSISTDRLHHDASLDQSRHLEDRFPIFTARCKFTLHHPITDMDTSVPMSVLHAPRFTGSGPYDDPVLSRYSPFERSNLEFYTGYSELDGEGYRSSASGSGVGDRGNGLDGMRDGKDDMGSNPSAYQVKLSCRAT
jgi:hypothetical protein